jgi:DNA-directed RNA polymerase subunit RPC12/RpoP
MLRFRCKNCGKSFEADGSMAGKLVVCPGCQIWMLVPKPGIDDIAVDSWNEEAQQGAVAKSATTAAAVVETAHRKVEAKPAPPPPPLKAKLKRAFSQRVLILLGLGCLSFMACFLPWAHVDNQGVEKGSAGYHFIFAPPNPRHYGVKVDLARTIIPMAFVLCATVAAAYLRREASSDQESKLSELEKSGLISRLEFSNPVVPPKKEDAETWPN